MCFINFIEISLDIHLKEWIYADAILSTVEFPIHKNLFIVSYILTRDSMLLEFSLLHSILNPLTAAIWLGFII